MIFHENGVFHLQTESYSYLFRVNPWGLLEHLHFGAPVQTSDWPGFVCNAGLGWGSSVLLDSADTGSCPDALALEWSGSGRGDYRETPMELNGAATDFRYVDFEIVDGIVPMDLPQAKDGGQTLVITLEQRGVRLKLYYTVFETALTRRAVVENIGDQPVTLTKMMSQCLDLPGDYEMTTFNGGWIAEMGKVTVPVTAARVVNESTTGASSNRHNPGFLLSQPGATEDQGWVYGFNLVYSGNHYASAQRSLQGLTRVMQGISADHFQWEIGPGERFETPEAVMSWSDSGFNGLSAKMHRFVNDHIVPKYWRYRHRPVLYNDWEGCMFDFDHRRLMGLARKAKSLGCELFVLDDGWFGKRDNDKAGLGDYAVNKKKLPRGLKGLGRDVRKLGMEFGLWFEPESVNMDSDLYRAHPDWALTDDFEPVLGRNQLLLDLTKPEVRDYIVENVCKTLDSANITYVKWDMNRIFSDYYSPYLRPEQQGEVAHRYMMGLYRMMKKLTEKFPHILFEGCASGGNRFDLGILCYFPQIWASDDTDAIYRAKGQTGYSYGYPMSTVTAHVSACPNHQTLRRTPLATRFNVAAFGVLGYECNLCDMKKEEVDEIKKQISLYKQWRDVLQFGTFYRGRSGNLHEWTCVSVDKSKAVGMIVQNLVEPNTHFEQYFAKGLDQDKKYHFYNVEKKRNVKPFGDLVNMIAPVHIKYDSLIHKAVDKFVKMPGEVEDYTTYGDVLMSGVKLNSAFGGTGYDEHTRYFQDFESRMYFMEEV